MRSRTPHGPCPRAARHEVGGHRGHPCLLFIRCTATLAQASRSPFRGPSIPSIESAREQNPGDDLFHEPEAQPKSVTAGVPPETTVGRSPRNEVVQLSDTSPL